MSDSDDYTTEDSMSETINSVDTEDAVSDSTENAEDIAPEIVIADFPKVGAKEIFEKVKLDKVAKDIDARKKILEVWESLLKKTPWISPVWISKKMDLDLDAYNKTTQDVKVECTENLSINMDITSLVLKTDTPVTQFVTLPCCVKVPSGYVLACYGKYIHATFIDNLNCSVIILPVNAPLTDERIIVEFVLIETETADVAFEDESFVPNAREMEGSIWTVPANSDWTPESKDFYSIPKKVDWVSGNVNPEHYGVTHNLETGETEVVIPPENTSYCVFKPRSVILGWSFEKKDTLIIDSCMFLLNGWAHFNAKYKVLKKDMRKSIKRLKSKISMKEDKKE